MKTNKEFQMKVSSKSNPNSIAGAIVNFLKEYDSLEIQVVGAGSLNQAMKGMAIARGFIAPRGRDLICMPAFSEFEIDTEERTALKLLVREV